MGENVDVRLETKKINGFSGHAGSDQLLRRAKGFTNPPKKTFIVHGEPDAESALESELKKIGFVCEIPGIREQIEL